MRPIVIVLLAWAAAPMPAKAACGTERWPVKTLADPRAAAVLAGPVQKVLLAELVTKTAPDRKALDAAMSTRFPEELSRYEVSALVIGYKAEADEDFHIVLADPVNPTRTMVAEIPAPGCVPAEYHDQFAALQAGFLSSFGKPSPKFRRLKQPVCVTAGGVGFFDFLHGQTGVAPNGFELHPLLSIVKGNSCGQKIHQRTTNQRAAQGS
jgi:hypothetical protein